MNEQPRLVLITAPMETAALERLRDLAPQLSIEHRPGLAPAGHHDGADVHALWQQAEILYSSTGLPSPVQVPRLRWVQLYWAGVDRVLEQPLFQTPVVFTNTSGIHAIPIAEHVLGVLLSWFRRVPNMLAYQARECWPTGAEHAAAFSPEELWGKTIGIAGYGSIGRQVARLASTFGMRVLALQRGAERRDLGFQLPGVGDPDGALPQRFYAPDELHTMLSESDMVVIALPLTPETRGLFDEAAFKAMKPTAFLVNISRGEIVDEPALERALREQRLAGAALDVFAQEPLPSESPLWRLPNLLISPHMSGNSPHYEERAAQVFGENLRRYLSGEPLFNVVSKEHKY